MEEWLVDGYNLLHSLGPRKKSLKEELFGRLAGFAAEGPRKVLIVLDGTGNDEEFSPYHTRLFQAVYSQSISADEYIERRLCQSKGQVVQVVVTRDRTITQMARGMGARVMDTEEFLRVLRESRAESEEIRFKHEVEQHRFHRPFDKKL